VVERGSIEENIVVQIIQHLKKTRHDDDGLGKDGVDY